VPETLVGHKLNPQAIPVAAERDRLMIAGIAEMTIERHVLLFTVNGVFCRKRMFKALGHPYRSRIEHFRDYRNNIQAANQNKKNLWQLNKSGTNNFFTGNF